MSRARVHWDDRLSSWPRIYQWNDHQGVKAGTCTVVLQWVCLTLKHFESAYLQFHVRVFFFFFWVFSSSCILCLVCCPFDRPSFTCNNHRGLCNRTSYVISFILENDSAKKSNLCRKRFIGLWTSLSASVTDDGTCLGFWDQTLMMVSYFCSVWLDWVSTSPFWYSSFEFNHRSFRGPFGF